MILEILVKVCRAPLYETVKIFLTNIFDKPSFLHQILEYVKKLAQTINVVDKKKILTDANLEVLVETIAELCRFHLHNLGVDDEYFKFVGCLEKNLLGCPSAAIHIKQLLDEIGGYNNTVFNEIYPTLDELKNSGFQLELKENIVKGKYPSVREYLETHLSLLREDFIAPLRDGVGKFLEDPTQKLEELHIYRDVRLQLLPNTKSQNYENILLYLNMVRNNLSAKNLIYSKRFMFGSLIMLTTGETFEDLILAVVTSRENELLSEGNVSMGFKLLILIFVTGGI